MKIHKMDDKQCLETFLEFLKERVTLESFFVTDEVTGNITHQGVKLSCGELCTVSQPEPLEIILRPATGAEQGAVVN